MIASILIKNIYSYLHDFLTSTIVVYIFQLNKNVQEYFRVKNLKNMNIEPNDNEATGLIVIVNGTRDENGDAWIGDFSYEQAFWAALLIPPEKEEEFYEALNLYNDMGTKFEINNFASEIVKEGIDGKTYPSKDQLNALELAYGDIVDNTHDIDIHRPVEENKFEI